jgi:hypothetical protein
MACSRPKGLRRTNGSSYPAGGALLLSQPISHDRLFDLNRIEDPLLMFELDRAELVRGQKRNSTC